MGEPHGKEGPNLNPNPNPNTKKPNLNSNPNPNPNPDLEAELFRDVKSVYYGENEALIDLRPSLNQPLTVTLIVLRGS